MEVNPHTLDFGKDFTARKGLVSCLYGYIFFL